MARLSSHFFRGSLLCTLALSTACASHSARTKEARAALDANQPDQARKHLNKALKVKTANDFPEKDRPDDPVLILDRSMVSLQLEDFEASSNDLQHADKAVEMLDMSRTAMADIGKYIFSDDSGPYRGSPYEKLMINTMNMVNYLARGDLNGARIEARRFSIMEKYLRENKSPASSMSAPGGYLAGFVFERSGESNVALRYYDEALAHVAFTTLAEPIARLSGPGSYSTPRLKAYLEKYAPTGEPTASSGQTATADGAQSAPKAPAASEEEFGELLVIINYGRVPAKIDKRIPIGLALTYASLFMTAAKQSTANRLAAQGLVTWVNYPELEETNRKLLVPRLDVDGRKMALEGAVAVDISARKAYEKERGKIIASAITRMIARVIAGESAGAATRAAGGDGLAGALVSLGTQAALTAADTPDTRSWATLPARMAVSRVKLPPGRHKVTITAQGLEKTEEFTLKPGGWHAAVLTILR
jgi:hypothetical protein